MMKANQSALLMAIVGIVGASIAEAGKEQLIQTPGPFPTSGFASGEYHPPHRTHEPSSTPRSISDLSPSVVVESTIAPRRENSTREGDTCRERFNAERVDELPYSRRPSWRP